MVEQGTHKPLVESSNLSLAIVNKIAVSLYKTARGGAVAARWAHNPKVVGSNPAPATIFYRRYRCSRAVSSVG